MKRNINNSTLLGNWKNCLNMKVTIIAFAMSAPGTDTEWFLLGLEDSEIREWMETMQTTTLLRSARILEIVPETWGDL